MCPDDRDAPPEASQDVTEDAAGLADTGDASGRDSGTPEAVSADTSDTWKHTTGTMDDPGRTEAGLTVNDVTDPLAPDATGTATGPRYRLRRSDGTPEVIGQGALGRVVVVWDEQLRRPVARKELMHPDSLPATVRFQREAQITALMEHPGVVPVHDMGRTEEGVFYYTMKWVQGTTLREAIDRAPDESARLALLPAFVDLCQCIAYAHSKGIIHRDIKPENTMVGPFGETVVIDWGIARVDTIREPLPDGIQPQDARMTRVGTVVGTPYYMSPEQAAGESVDGRTDVWALGMVLCEIVSGRLPHSGASNEVLARLRARHTPHLPEGIAPELASIIQRALSPLVQDRYSSAAVLGDEVQDWLAGERVGAHAYSTTEVVMRLVRQHRNAVGVAVAALVVLAIVGITAAIQVVNERDTARAAEAEATHQRNEALAQYAASLEQAAHRSFSAGRHGEARLLAAKALTLAPTPEAWGLVMGSTSAGMPELAWTADEDACWTTALSPDGSHLACTRPGEVLVWTTADHQLVHRLTFEGPGTHALAWSPSGRRVASGRAPYTMVWDVDTGMELARLDTAASGTWSMAFVDEDHLLAGQDNGNIVHFGVASGQQRAVWKGHTLRVIALEISSPWLASGSGDGTTRLWKLSDGSHRTLPSPAVGASTVTFSPDGAVLATGGARGDAEPLLHLWDPATGQLLRSIDTGERQPQDAQWTTDGRRIVIGTRNSVARIHRVEDGSLIHEIVLPDEWNIKSVAVGGGGLYAHGNWGRPRMWTLPVHLGGLAPSVASTFPVDLCWRDDGQSYQGVLRGGDWARWDAVNGDLLATHRVAGSVQAARCGPDGAFRFSVDDVLFFTDPDGTLRRQVELPGAIETFGGHGGRYLSTRGGRILGKVGTSSPISSPQLSKELWALGWVESRGEVVVASRYSPTLWRLDDSTLEVRDTVTVEYLSALAVHPDGHTVAAGMQEGDILLYTSESFEPIARDRGDARWILRIVWTPDGRRFAAGTGAGKVRVYDSDGVRLAIFSLNDVRRVRGMAFSPDGTQLAVSNADGAVSRWRLDALDIAPQAHLEAAKRASGMVLEGTKPVFRVRTELP